jgi:hypothetical protein
VSKNDLPPGGGKKAYERRLLPCRVERMDEKAYERRPLPHCQGGKKAPPLPGREVCRKSRMPDTWRAYPAGSSSPSSPEHAVVTRCGGQAEGIIAVIGVVNADETGRSRPIGAARRLA